MALWHTCRGSIHFSGLASGGSSLNVLMTPLHHADGCSADMVAALYYAWPCPNLHAQGPAAGLPLPARQTIGDLSTLNPLYALLVTLSTRRRQLCTLSAVLPLLGMTRGPHATDQITQVE